jgi:hypothetical protein
MPAGHLAYNFRRRLIADAFVGDMRRLRGALDDDTFDALVDGLAATAAATREPSIWRWRLQ